MHSQWSCSMHVTMVLCVLRKNFIQIIVLRDAFYNKVFIYFCTCSVFAVRSEELYFI